MKKLMSKMSRAKILASIFVLCLVVFAGYMGYHKFTAKADQYVTDGVINEISELHKDLNQQSGTKDNPFLVLEIVPQYSAAEFGALINGCEPMDFSDQMNKYNNLNYSVGSSTQKLFADEIPYIDQNQWSKLKDHYALKTGSITMSGYYERVANGKGCYKYNGTNYADTSLVSGQTVYSPEFDYVGEDNGNFIWVTINSDKYKSFAKEENKYAKNKNANIKFSEGDRIYTERTSDASEQYYEYKNDGSLEYNSSFYFIHYNTFIRTCLDVKTKSDIENYHIIVKTIVPDELNDYPEWIDYADLIYMGCANTGAGSLWNSSQDRIRISKALRDKYPGSSTYSTSHDLDWNVAQNLFFKVNGFEQYDGTKYNFAPLVVAKAAMDGLNGMYGASVKNYGIDYKTLDIRKAHSITDSKGQVFWDPYENNAKASESNFIKFCIMNFMMDQDDFYQKFYQGKKASDGKPVIQTKGSGKDAVGYNTAQEEGRAQTAWNVAAFLPYVANQLVQYRDNYAENADDSDVVADMRWYVRNYQYHVYDDIGQTSTGKLSNATFIFNNDTLFSQMFNTNAISKNDNLNDEAFTWFRDEKKKDMGSMSSAQMIQYLLNYKKKGKPDDDYNPQKGKLKVLEIEPCNSFTLTEEYLTALLPSSKYSGQIEIDYMTTQEFNGSHVDLNGDYDFVYIGMNTDKFNRTEMTLAQDGKNSHEYVLYNNGLTTSDANDPDLALTGKVYLHVGDLVKNGSLSYRYSGDDISSLRKQDLLDYVAGGNPLVLADTLAAYNGKRYLRTVDTSSNMSKLVANVYKKDCVCGLSDLNDTIFDYTEYTGAKVEITESPKTYTETSKDANTEVKAKLEGTKLKFKFKIGYSKNKESYGVKILVDTNYDGVLTDNASQSEVMYNSYDVAAKSGLVYNCGTLNEDGTEKPAEYEASYDIKDIPTGRKNGALAWKIVIYSIDNVEYYTCLSGTSWYQGDTTATGTKVGKYEIRVLQIVDNDSEGTVANLEDSLKKSSTAFGKYANNLEDYEISVKTLSLSDWLKVFADAASDDQTERTAFSQDGGTYYYPNEVAGTELQGEQGYNVFLVSCGNKFQKADNSRGAVSFMNYVAEQGSSVLYTQDSVTNQRAEDVSEMLTQNMKDVMNMSRFSAKEYKDKATYVAGTLDKNKKNKTYKITNGSLEYTYYKVMNLGASDTTYPVYDKSIWKLLDESTNAAYGMSGQKAKTATRINKGTITSYPYKIDSSIAISGTQGQTFQLNMENPNLNVWYCLGGKDNTTYGISPNDATNNYYLYTVDNTTYAGINLADQNSEMEVKLFINALIGTYEHSYKYPAVAVNSIRDLEEKSDIKVTLKDKTEKRRVYVADVPTSTETVDVTQYRDYEPGSTAMPKGTPKPTPTVTPEPTPTVAPATEEPTEDPNATEEPEETVAPTPEPTVAPITSYENPNGNSNQSFISDMSLPYWADITDSSVIVVKYTSDKSQKQYNPVNASMTMLTWMIDDKSKNINYAPAGELKACNGDSTDPYEIQTAKITIGELKKNCGASHIDKLQLVSSDWRSVLLSVTVYLRADDVSGGDSGSGDDGSGSTDPAEPEEPKEDTSLVREEVTGTKYLADGDDMKIYFTPYDGYISHGNVRQFAINYVNKIDDCKLEGLPSLSHVAIKYVFQKVSIYDKDKDVTETHIYKYQGKYDDVLQSYVFTVNDRNWLTSDEEFFIGYNKAVAETQFNYIRFDISNKKKDATTYLQLSPTTEQHQVDDNVYVFPLD